MAITASKPFSYQGPMPKETIVVEVPNSTGDTIHEWVLDVPALTSNYECIYGRGCKGTTPYGGETESTSCGSDKSVTGCCRTEVGLDSNWDPDDNIERLSQYVEQLDEDEWENIDLIRAGRRWYKTTKSGSRFLSERGNCIFLNLGDKLPGKTGCALYHLAERIGEDPKNTRPMACHTVPLRNIRMGEGNQPDSHRRLLSLAPRWYGWFGPQPEDWWCTDSPEAYIGDRPVYISMESEMRLLCGDQAYEQIKEVLDQVMEERGERIKKGWGNPVMLPMPTVSKREVQLNREYREANNSL